MRSAKELAETEEKLRAYIAKGMPDLSHVECETCRKRIEVTHAVDLGQFLAVGWPKCCGATMRLFTAREERERAAREPKK